MCVYVLHAHNNIEYIYIYIHCRHNLALIPAIWTAANGHFQCNEPGKMRMAQGCSVASLLNCADNSGAKRPGCRAGLEWKITGKKMDVGGITHRNDHC